MATDLPKLPASLGLEGITRGNIGNYKGVMLCNRPSEPGEPLVRERYE